MCVVVVTVELFLVIVQFFVLAQQQVDEIVARAGHQSSILHVISYQLEPNQLSDDVFAGERMGQGSTEAGGTFELLFFVEKWVDECNDHYLNYYIAVVFMGI